MSKNRAFTLPEVLITLTVVSLMLSSLLLVFSRGVNSSLFLTKDSESFKMEVSLFWDLERKVLGAKRIRIENNALYMITSGGSHFPGVVECAYYLEGDTLRYHEFPYPYGRLEDIYDGIDYELGRVESFRVYASDGNIDQSAYEGLPKYVKVVLNGREFVFETLGK